MRKLDVCGLNCPEPMLMVKRAIGDGEKEIEVLSDAVVAVENITRLCGKMGYSVVKSEKDGKFELQLRKN